MEFREDYKENMISRSYEAGLNLANSIVAMANLMQKKTKANFYKGLMKRLEEETKR